MKNTLFSVPAIVLLTILACRSQREVGGFIGSYRSVSESEWTLTLSLLQGGVAEIILESWKPGEYAKRTTEKKNAHWIDLKDRIAVQYEGKSDTLEYDQELSLSRLGKDGGAPGLLQNKPGYDGLFNDVPLWKLPHRF